MFYDFDEKLLDAIKEIPCNVKVFREALDAGAIVRLVDFRDENILHKVARCGIIEVVPMLLERDVKYVLDFPNNDAETPLHLATCLYGRFCGLMPYGLLRKEETNAREMIGRMLLAGADWTLKNWEGKTSCEFARRFNRLDIFERYVCKRVLPVYALACEELEHVANLFVPREIINLMLIACLEINLL